MGAADGSRKKTVLYKDKLIEIARSDQNGKEGKIDQAEQPQIAQRFARHATAVFPQRDQACKRGDGRSQSADIDGNEQAAEKARQYIDQNYANPDLSLRMLADMVGLSPAYFGKIFTAYTTYSFNDYLTNTRMKKAASLLVETKLPISQISESIGILNTNYFYSVFKKKFGMTPLAYRRSKSNLQADKPDSQEEQ